MLTVSFLVSFGSCTTYKVIPRLRLNQNNILRIILLLQFVFNLVISATTLFSKIALSYTPQHRSLILANKLSSVNQLRVLIYSNNS